MRLKNIVFNRKENVTDSPDIRRAHYLKMAELMSHFTRSLQVKQLPVNLKRYIKQFPEEKK